jgi:hypothetical protein
MAASLWHFPTLLPALLRGFPGLLQSKQLLQQVLIGSRGRLHEMVGNAAAGGNVRLHAVGKVVCFLECLVQLPDAVFHAGNLMPSSTVGCQPWPQPRVATA